jgi:pyruvate,water dikinase
MEHERNRALTPPRNLGAAPIDTGPIDRFDSAPIDSTEADVLRGTAASVGIARGAARVALGPDDFRRIQPGDIIVCPSSNPSWVPVFTIAGGLVTNTGGLLSHAAVVAREFGLPAVVGVRDATTTIADGRLVEIDGTLGTIRLL